MPEPEFLGDTNEVIRLARNVVEADFTPDDVKPHQRAAYGHIRTLTGKLTWSNADVSYYSAIEAENLIAAVFVLNHETGNSTEIPGIQQLWNEAITLLNGITGSTVTSTAGAESDQIEKTPWHDWGHNSEVRPPNKLKKFRTG